MAEKKKNTKKSTPKKNNQKVVMEKHSLNGFSNLLLLIIIAGVGYLFYNLNSYQKELEAVKTEAMEKESLREKQINDIIKKFQDGFKNSTEYNAMLNDLAKVNSKILQVEQNVLDKEKDVALIKNKMQEIEEDNEIKRGTGLVLITAINHLKIKVDMGGEFQNELEALKTVSRKQKSVNDLVKFLTPYQNDGIKTLYELKKEFNGLVSDAVFMAKNPLSKDAGIFAKIWHKIKSLIKIRKTDINTDEVNAETVLAKVEIELKNDNLLGAQDEVSKLKSVSSIAYKHMKSWIINLENKIKSDKMFSQTTSYAVKKIMKNVKK